MALQPTQLRTLQAAAVDEDGRVVAFDANSGPLVIKGVPGEEPIELGEANLHDLVRGGYLSRENDCSYLITGKGRAALEG